MKSLVRAVAPSGGLRCNQLVSSFARDLWRQGAAHRTLAIAPGDKDRIYLRAVSARL